ncbi:hypothetical protein JIN85_17820 [Luteolibacter pohnpeiensis]|uniref:Uncharacterized protein n=1 Tax=Luteolibacter pohnpeiensis TaxID=454153 RepID=A0A934S8U8_9BACT|nr:hypothetical protein [Luteolibacter pohnpeiensis]MBK1884282.1 hypothetical protein [Luteolibacter pohnpeiensis]
MYSKLKFVGIVSGCALVVIIFIFIIKIRNLSSSPDSETASREYRALDSFSTHSPEKSKRRSSRSSISRKSMVEPDELVAALNYDQIFEEFSKIKESGQSYKIPIEDYRKIRNSLILLDKNSLMRLTTSLIMLEDIRLLDAFKPTIMRSLMNQGATPEDLSKWISEIESPLMRGRLLESAGALYFETDSTGFDKMLNLSEDEYDRIKLLTGYYQKLIKTQPERSIKEFLSQLSNGSGQDELQYLIGLLPENTNFRSIADLISSQTQLGAVGATQKLLESWGRFAPAEAANYAWSSEKISPDLMKTAMEQWYKSNPSEARNWLYMKPPSPKLDNALGQMVLSEAGTRPEESLRISEMIENSELKESVQHKIYQKWYSLQPEKAEKAWSEKNNRSN